MQKLGLDLKPRGSVMMVATSSSLVMVHLVPLHREWQLIVQGRAQVHSL